MRYSYEFKRKCVEMYHRGEYPETPNGISEKRFHWQVRKWVRIEESCGPDALRHKNQNKEWTPEERYALVARVLAGESIITAKIGKKFLKCKVTVKKKRITRGQRNALASAKSYLSFSAFSKESTSL